MPNTTFTTFKAARQPAVIQSFKSTLKIYSNGIWMYQILERLELIKKQNGIIDTTKTNIKHGLSNHLCLSEDLLIFCLKIELKEINQLLLNVMFEILSNPTNKIEWQWITFLLNSNLWFRNYKGLNNIIKLTNITTKNNEPIIRQDRVKNGLKSKYNKNDLLQLGLDTLKIFDIVDLIKNTNNANESNDHLLFILYIMFCVFLLCDISYYHIFLVHCVFALDFFFFFFFFFF